MQSSKFVYFSSIINIVEKSIIAFGKDALFICFIKTTEEINTQIDSLVYQLYVLIDEEIKVVEKDN